jgi:hypothetical protein
MKTLGGKTESMQIREDKLRQNRLAKAWASYSAGQRRHQSLHGLLTQEGKPYWTQDELARGLEVRPSEFEQSRVYDTLRDMLMRREVIIDGEGRYILARREQELYHERMNEATKDQRIF